MVVALLVSSYLLFDPADWLYRLMDLTYMSMSFKIFISALGVGGFLVMFAAEKYLFPPLAKFIGKAKVRLTPNRQKKRKEYKVIQEAMRLS